MPEIQKLPLEEQRKILEALTKGLNKGSEQKAKPISEDQIESKLFEQGIIGNLPNLADYTDEDDDFEPIEIEGEPISETIIRERR